MFRVAAGLSGVPTRPGCLFLRNFPPVLLLMIDTKGRKLCERKPMHKVYIPYRTGEALVVAFLGCGWASGLGLSCLTAL